MSELEKSEMCHSCGFETHELKYYGPSVFGKTDGKWLCDLCASTFAGTAVDYPTHYDGPTLATICYVGNVILAEIRKARS